MWKILTAASTALVLIGTPALAEWDEWDADDDSAVAEEEFGTGFEEAGVYGEWDQDQDGALSADEFDSGVFGLYDQDEDGAWSEEEYGAFEEDGWF